MRTFVTARATFSPLLSCRVSHAFGSRARGLDTGPLPPITCISSALADLGKVLRAFPVVVKGEIVAISWTVKNRFHMPRGANTRGFTIAISLRIHLGKSYYESRRENCGKRETEHEAASS